MKNFLNGYFAVGLVLGLGTALIFFLLFIGVNYCPLLPCKGASIVDGSTVAENIGLLELKVQEDLARSSKALAWAAGGSIVVGVIGACVLIYTLLETQKAVAVSAESNRIATDANRRSLRAYVNVAKTSVCYEGGTIKFRISISNSGTTPAKDVAFSSSGEFSQFPKHHSPSVSTHTEGGSRTTLAKGENFIFHFQLSSSQLADLALQEVAARMHQESAADHLDKGFGAFRTLLEDPAVPPDFSQEFSALLNDLEDYQSNLRALADQGFGFTLVMLIVYRDIYGNRRRSLFKGFITLDQMREKKALLQICPKHNITT